MTETPITHKLTTAKSASASDTVLATSVTQGVECVWRFSMIDDLKSAYFSWTFNWEELKLQGIDGLTGYILLSLTVTMIPGNLRSVWKST